VVASGAVFLASGAALVVYILTGAPLALVLGVLVVLGGIVVGVLIWGDEERRRMWLSRVVVGVPAGLVATACYDASRWLLVEVGGFSASPFAAFPLFGQALAGGPGDGSRTAIGVAFHLLNGTAFGIAYTVWFGHRPFWTGVLFAFVLEAFMLSLYPGWLDIRSIREFTQMSVLGHVVYGTALGLLAGSGVRLADRRMHRESPGGAGRGYAVNGLVVWADRLWIVGPRRLVARLPGLRGLAGDGHFLVVVPLLAVLLPVACLLGGLACGLFRWGYEDVYTESVILLAMALAVGAFSSQLGVLGVAGFCAGDLISAAGSDRVFRSGTSPWFSGALGEGPLAELAHRWLPLFISYLLLAAGVVLLPRAARAVVATVGRGRRIPALPAWALVSGLLTVIIWLGTDAWAAAAPTLVRPVFTWAAPGGVPTVQAMTALQESGGVVVAAAVAATLVRQAWLGVAMLPGIVRDRLEAAERGDREAAPPRPPRPPGTARAFGAAVLTSALATLALAGILERAWLWAVAFAVLLTVRLLRTGLFSVAGLATWQRIAAALPAWARLIALWLVSRVVVQGVSSDLIGSYTGLAVFVLVSIVVVFVVFPGEPPRARGRGPAARLLGGTVMRAAGRSHPARAAAAACRRRGSRGVDDVGPAEPAARRAGRGGQLLGVHRLLRRRELGGRSGVRLVPARGALAGPRLRAVRRHCQGRDRGVHGQGPAHRRGARAVGAGARRPPVRRGGRRAGRGCPAPRRRIGPCRWGQAPGRRSRAR
jgi:hypothetical protein